MTKPGFNGSIISLEEAKARFVHRFTMEHKPAWANEPLAGGQTFYAPQFASDEEWFLNSDFTVSRRFCSTTGQTYPLGQFLDSPYSVERRAAV